MRLIDGLLAGALTTLLAVGGLTLSLLPDTSALAQSAPNLAVGPQYVTAHVYVTPDDYDRFVSSVVATFGGTTSKRGVFTVTPTPSKTMSQLVFAPVGILSVFGFKTPIPYPFGAERHGYLVTNMDSAISAARLAGADVIVSTFSDPIGRDAIIQWPGGVNMQLYWHTIVPSYKPLETIPENRVYVSALSADPFVHSFLKFSQGTVTSDDRQAPGIEIGRPNDTYRRIRIESKFGRITVLVTDGHLPYPYGRETTGYEVPKLSDTLSKGRAAGVAVIVGIYRTSQREAAIVQFPGGYIAEIHSPTGTLSPNAGLARAQFSRTH